MNVLMEDVVDDPYKPLQDQASLLEQPQHHRLGILLKKVLLEVSRMLVVLKVLLHRVVDMHKLVVLMVVVEDHSSRLVLFHQACV